MDCAATAALPLPESGRIRPTLTLPAPIALAGWAGGWAGAERFWNISLGELPPEQPDRTAPAMAARTANQRGTAPARDDLACEIGSMGAALLDADHLRSASLHHGNSAFSR